MDNIQFEIQKELREIAPNLARLREKSSSVTFKTPPQYFETLADNVLSKVNAEHKFLGETKNLMSYENIRMRFNHSITHSRLVYRVAATFLIAVTAFWLVPKTFNNLKRNSQTINVNADYSRLNEEDIRILINDSKTDIDSEFLTNTLGVTEKELSLNVQDNSGSTSDENLNDAIDKYIKENDPTTNL